MKNILPLEQISEIHTLCFQYNIKVYTINNDGSIDVNGDVDLINKGLEDLPLRFSNVSGNFICDNNQLTTLDGCPSHVGEFFSCSNNKLTSLVGGPLEVGGGFECMFNQLNSLVGAPTKIGQHFICINNNLTSLEGLPLRIGGIIIFYGNPLNSFYSDVNSELGNKLGIFIKYMNHYDVWTPQLNKDNAQDLIDEIKDGLK